MGRIRSVLIDCQNSKMYTNVANTNFATTADIIASTRKSTSLLALKPPGTAIAAVVATQGTTYNSSGLINNITYKWLDATGNSTNVAAPTISAANVALRKVSSTGTTSRVYYNLPKLVANGTLSNTATSVSVGDTIYWDVINAGNLPGKGLIITSDYYPG